MALDARRGPGRADNIASPAGFGRDDWSSILSRVKDRIGQDNLSLIAAGVAFFAMLALFPAIAALVGFYGFFADPADVEPLLAMAGNFLPETVLSVLEGRSGASPGARALQSVWRRSCRSASPSGAHARACWPWSRDWA
ncbi:YhjD/YihY/BrkB family envelope integrity protein [Minwuia thermotolerans]|nr:YhjD/YihY/BrkB family envelope integrity protein [Minwuia thermotolerans]